MDENQLKLELQFSKHLNPNNSLETEDKFLIINTSVSPINNLEIVRIVFLEDVIKAPLVIPVAMRAFLQQEYQKYFVGVENQFWEIIYYYKWHQGIIYGQ